MELSLIRPLLPLLLIACGAISVVYSASIAAAGRLLGSSLWSPPLAYSETLPILIIYVLITEQPLTSDETDAHKETHNPATPQTRNSPTRAQLSYKEGSESNDNGGCKECAECKECKECNEKYTGSEEPLSQGQAHYEAVREDKIHEGKMAADNDKIARGDLRRPGNKARYKRCALASRKRVGSRWADLNRRIRSVQKFIEERPLVNSQILLGGMMGAFIGIGASAIPPKIGMGPFFVLFVTGQVLAALLMDSTGLYWATKIPTTWQTLIGNALVILGAIVFQWTSLRVGPSGSLGPSVGLLVFMMLCSLLAGSCAVIQGGINSRLMAMIGMYTPIFSFASGLVLLVILASLVDGKPNLRALLPHQAIHSNELTMQGPPSQLSWLPFLHPHRMPIQMSTLSPNESLAGFDQAEAPILHGFDNMNGNLLSQFEIPDPKEGASERPLDSPRLLQAKTEIVPADQKDLVRRRPEVESVEYPRDLWKVFGGILSISSLMAVMILPRLVGFALTASWMITGELLLSLVTDHYGWFQLRQRPADLTRVLGVSFVLGGVALTQASRARAQKCKPLTNDTTIATLDTSLDTPAATTPDRNNHEAIENIDDLLYTAGREEQQKRVEGEWRKRR